MAARVLVFCKKSVASLTPAALEEEINGADLMTLAESLDLPEGEEEAVEAMWNDFRIETPSADELNGVSIHWHPKLRPIQVRRTAPLEGELAEYLEELEGHTSKNAPRVRKHLEATTEIVEFEMSIDGSNHLAATLSEVSAFFVAERGDGLVLFYHREFASPDDRGAALLKL